MEPTLPLRARGSRGASQWRGHQLRVLKGVCATEHLEEEFAVFLAGLRWLVPASDVGGGRRSFSTSSFATRAARSGNRSWRNPARKSIEVVEHVERPLNLSGPATVETRAFPGVTLRRTVIRRSEPSAALADRRSSSVISSASASSGRSTSSAASSGDQLQNGHAEFGCWHLEHIRGVLSTSI